MPGIAQVDIPLGEVDIRVLIQVFLKNIRLSRQSTVFLECEHIVLVSDRIPIMPKGQVQGVQRIEIIGCFQTIDQYLSIAFAKYRFTVQEISKTAVVVPVRKSGFVDQGEMIIDTNARTDLDSRPEGIPAAFKKGFQV